MFGFPSSPPHPPSSADAHDKPLKFQFKFKFPLTTLCLVTHNCSLWPALYITALSDTGITASLNKHAVNLQIWPTDYTKHWHWTERMDTCTKHCWYVNVRWSQWQCGLRRGSAAACLLGLWVRIPPGTCMSVSFECCVLSGRGLCAGLITRPEESNRLWCVYDLEASITMRA
jgi:hypothetical protein